MLPPVTPNTVLAERFIIERVQGGAALPGTYPPNEATRAAFEAWKTSR